MARARKILSREWIESIAAQLDIDPGDTSRVVVDARHGDVLRIYVEKFGTDRLLGVELPGDATVEIR